MSSNTDYIQRSLDVEARLPKAPLAPLEWTAEKQRFYLAAYRQEMGRHLPSKSAVLDYGCGWGTLVASLLDSGFDAYGVDIMEYWGKDADHYGEVPRFFPPEVTRRLFAVSPKELRLPFPEGSFNLILSYQVFEHVFDLAPVFREHARLLKTGGIAIHHYPRMLAPIEPHTGLPFAPLSRYRWYLALWALAGKRSDRQRGLSWRETLRTNEMEYRTTHYISKRQMLKLAREAGLHAYFMNHLPVAGTRIGKLYDRFEGIRMGRMVRRPLVGLNMNYVLILRQRE